MVDRKEVARSTNGDDEVVFVDLNYRSQEVKKESENEDNAKDD